PVQVLDLAAGTGVWSLPMAQCNKNVKVDALDFAPILAVTKEYATKFGVADRYNYLSGGWQDVKLQAGHYDFIILGHILHSEGKELSQRMLKYCADALKPGGKLIVAEFFSNNEQTGPVFSSLFALNMMIVTTDGCVFTVSELQDMIKQAGLQN